MHGPFLEERERAEGSIEQGIPMVLTVDFSIRVENLQVELHPTTISSAAPLALPWHLCGP
jgi:hypothetical protein